MNIDRYYIYHPGTQTLVALEESILIVVAAEDQETFSGFIDQEDYPSAIEQVDGVIDATDIIDWAEGSSLWHSPLDPVGPDEPPTFKR